MNKSKTDVVWLNGFYVEVESAEPALKTDSPLGPSEDELTGGIKGVLGGAAHEVSDAIKMACDYLQTAIQQLDDASEVSAQFGIKLAGERAIPFVAKASGEASFVITVVWKNDKGNK